MNRKRLVIGLFVAMMVVLAGCSENTASGDELESAQNIDMVSDVPGENGVWRIADAETEVACYVVVKGNEPKSIDCVDLGGTSG